MLQIRDRFHYDRPFQTGLKNNTATPSPSTLTNPSNSAIEISKAALQGLEKIYLPFFQYKKAGVMVTEFVPETERMTSLFDEDLHAKHRPIMQLIDVMNKRLGADKIKLGSMDVQRTWKMNQKNLSPRYNHRPPPNHQSQSKITHYQFPSFRGVAFRESE